MTSNNFARKMKSLVTVTGCGSTFFAGMLYYNNDERFFTNFAMPVLRFFVPPEKAHKLGIFVCKWNLIPKNDFIDPPNLVTLKFYGKISKNYFKFFLNSQLPFVDLRSKIQ